MKQNNKIYNKKSHRFVEKESQYYKKLIRDGWHVNQQNELSPPKQSNSNVAALGVQSNINVAAQVKESNVVAQVKNDVVVVKNIVPTETIPVTSIMQPLALYLAPNDLLSLYVSNKENQIALNDTRVLHQLSQQYQMAGQAITFEAWYRSHLALQIPLEKQYLFDLENQRYIDDTVIHQLIHNQSDIKYNHVLITFDWMYQIRKALKMKVIVFGYVCTLFLVYLTTRKPILTKNNVELYACAMFYYTNQLFDEYPLEINDYITITGKYFNSKQLIAATAEVINVFHGQLIFPCPMLFIDLKNDDIVALTQLATCCLDIAMYKPSLIAETCTYMITGYHTIYSLQEIATVCHVLMPFLTVLSKKKLNFLAPRAESILNLIQHKCPKHQKELFLTKMAYHEPWHLGEINKLKVLGKGAYGKVEKIKRKQCGKEYAMKSTTTNKESSALAALQEIGLLTLLKNKSNIVPLCGFDYNLKTIDMILPVYTSSLATIKFDKTKLNVFFKQILLAVQQCHSCDIIHRDIKMENLLFNATDQSIVLIDFGISVPFQSIRKPNATDYANTFHYRPPECLLTNPWPYDQKIDIWAIGCVFYNMITGKDVVTHYDSKSAIIDLFQLLGTPTLTTWPALSQMTNVQTLPQYPGQINQLKQKLAPYTDLVLACLTINPENRPTANDLLKNYF